ncbi:MAG: DUF1190 domain-containing protein [Alphaproteobacteria bacterium]|nr:DUF1190 domain-containing protein [Alphaproteobacteria bacterium]
MATVRRRSFWQRYGMAVFGGVLALIAVFVVASALLRRPSDAALVLATSGDCLRVFDNDACADIVAKADDIHTRTAPRFPERHFCTMMFGDGCTRAAGPTGAAATYVPEIAVILMTRAKDDEPPALLPLYLGMPRANETVETGRRVFYRGIAVGQFYQNRFGGAQLSRVNNASGQPLTSADVQRLRRG